jgi:hypothetical protein
MADGTSRLPSKMISSTRELGLLMPKDRFSGMERSSEKNSDLRSKFDCGSGRDGVKGQDERQSTAPLTPSRPPQEDFARELKKRA